MKILVIDNNIDPAFWGSQDICRLIDKVSSPKSGKTTPAGTTIYVRRAPHGDLPRSPKGFNAVIVSGSKTPALAQAPWIDRLLGFIAETVHAEIPLLGICYGHQMLIRSLGGIQCIQKSANPEFGWTEVHVRGESPLTQGLPEKFYTFSAHFDEAARLPLGMKNLASSPWCAIQACQVEKRPAFGIQFHPEKALEEAEKILMHRKKEKKPIKLLHPNHGRSLYNPEIGEILFKNFLKV